MTGGVRCYAILYDIIPIQFPQYCHESIQTLFSRYLNLISGLNGIIADSESVAVEYKKWRKNNILSNSKSFHVTWFHLGADFNKEENPKEIPQCALEVFEQMSKRPTLLEVSTIEPRKGYHQALSAFEQLWSKGIDVNFIIVGKLGWKMDDFSKYVQNHSELGHRLFWLQGISDEYLKKIYTNSSAVLMPSDAEGFGLAIIEGVYYKKPLILRDLPVFREIAGDHATYFSGLKASDLSSCIEIWLKEYEKGEVISSLPIRPLTWKESTQMLVKRLGLEE